MLGFVYLFIVMFFIYTFIQQRCIELIKTTLQSNNPTLFIDSVLWEAASLSFLTYNKKRTMPKTWQGVQQTSYKNQNYVFFKCFFSMFTVHLVT